MTFARARAAISLALSPISLKTSLGLSTKLLWRQTDLGGLAVIENGVIYQSERRAGVAGAGYGHQRLHVPDLGIIDDLRIALHRCIPES